MDKFEIKRYVYYGVIGIISMVMLIFLPMLGSEVGVDFKLPNSFAGWSVWLLTKLVGAILNMVIFHCFMQQAKSNIKDNKYYIEAHEFLSTKREKERKPRSPKQWVAKQYSTKGVMLFITSIMSAVVLTNAVLTFDYVIMLTYLFTLIIGFIFGIIQMKIAEEYWTVEYYQYYLYIKENEKENIDDRVQRESLQELARTSSEESTGH